MWPAGINTRYPRHRASEIRKPARTDRIRFTPELRHGPVDGLFSARHGRGDLPRADSTGEQQIAAGFV